MKGHEKVNRGPLKKEVGEAQDKLDTFCCFSMDNPTYIG